MGSRKRNEDEPEPWKNAKLTDNDEVPPSSELEQKKLVVLNPADCDPDFIIEGDGLQGSSLYEQGFAYCWSGARANVGITGGKYCFGCKVVTFQAVEMEDTGPNQQNLCRVGISRGDDVVGSLGETSRSFGYGSTGKFLNSSKLSDYGEKFGLGDIIICAVNLEEKPLASISFSKNGKCLGTAMKFNAGPLGLGVVDSEVKNLQWESVVFPHVLLKNVGVELQFSVEDGLVPEEGFKPWASALEDGNAIVGPVFGEPTDCEVMMMVGMPASGKTTWADKWVKEHPEKRYVLLGTDMVLDQMKVPGHLRKKNYDEPLCYYHLISRSNKVLNTLLSRAGTTPRNYILDGTYVYKKVRKCVVGSFKLFKKIAVVVFPSPEKENARFMKRCGELGEGEVFADVMYEMLANYVLPVSKDMPGSDELFDKVMFIELNREESQRRLDEMKQEVSNLNSNKSSPHSCRNSVQSYPFSPNYGESPVWPYPIPSPQYIGASAVSTGSWSSLYSSVPPNYQYHMLNQMNTYQTHQGAVLVGIARSFSEPYEGNPRPPVPSFVTPQGTYSDYFSTPTTPYSSYAAETVAKNEDLLTQILVCVPPQPLLCFKCVSKHWLSLISCPKFCNSHTFQNPNPKVSAFFVSGNGTKGIDFISLCNNNTSSGAHFKPLSFTPDSENIKILQSRNGLLLCEPKSNFEYYGFNPTTTESEPNNIYYVVNPTTRQYSELTLPSAPTKSTRYCLRLQVDLAFDPSKSIHYKVFVIGQRAISSNFYNCIWTYSSETRSWRLHEPTGTGWPDLIASDGGPVLCNGTINWMNFWTGSFVHYDIEKDSFQTVVGLETNKYQQQYFMESGGHLNLILFHSCSQFDVLEMRRDYSGWFIKYSGDFDPMYSEMVRDYPSLGQYASCTPFSVFFLAREENEENSYLLLQIPGKVVTYNLRDKTFKKVCDLSPKCYETSHWDVGWAHVYPHMETLARV